MAGCDHVGPGAPLDRHRRPGDPALRRQVVRGVGLVRARGAGRRSRSTTARCCSPAWSPASRSRWRPRTLPSSSSPPTTRPHAMSRTTMSRTFLNQSYSDIASKVISGNSLRADVVSITGAAGVHPAEQHRPGLPRRHHPPHRHRVVVRPDRAATSRSPSRCRPRSPGRRAQGRHRGPGRADPLLGARVGAQRRQGRRARLGRQPGPPRCPARARRCRRPSPTW